MAAPRKDNVKDIIMNCTEELLHTNSFDSMTLAQIATAAGVSKGTLYYHYKTKEEILLDIMERYLDKQKADLFNWIDDPSKDTSLHRMVKYVIERDVYETGPRIHLLYNACVGNEQIQDRLLQRYQVFEAIIADKISERIKEIDPDYMSMALLLLSDGLLVQRELGNKEFDIDSFIAKTAEYVTRYEKIR